MTAILGISAFYHDSAACLVRDGDIVAAAQEERFSRKKHDASFPHQAIAYCLKEGGLKAADLDYVSFYDKPFTKFHRLLETYLAYAPRGWGSFIKAMPLWLKEKLHLPRIIEEELAYEKTILFTGHHESHAASAFFPSPYEEAAVITLDGVGEWSTAAYGVGRGNRLELIKEIRFPHSLGMLYSAFTYYTGFKVNSGEYKVMGLAPYGEPRYVDLIRERLIDIRDDGSFRLNMDYFNYCAGLTMTNERFHKLLGGPPRQPETMLTQREMDLARSVQEITEEVMLRMARHVHGVTGMQNLCLAGGVALNCVGNGRILREGPFKSLWIQPAAGDAGGALGTALAVWHTVLEQPRKLNGALDGQKGSLLGPAYANAEVEDYLRRVGARWRRVDDEDALVREVAEHMASEKVVGWMHGRMEFGPRALGGRSIVGDPRSTQMQTTMNLKIKYRESFRPFAPSVLAERCAEYFELDCESPYMLLVAPVRRELQRPMTAEQQQLFGIDKLKVPRSNIPAITHVDYSARVQTVHRERSPRYHKLIEAFRAKTGCGLVINTSFNVRGEPIICSPEDAYRCFMRTQIDVLVVEDCVLLKSEQPEFKDQGDWKKEFTLD